MSTEHAIEAPAIATLTNVGDRITLTVIAYEPEGGCDESGWSCPTITGLVRCYEGAAPLVAGDTALVVASASRLSRQLLRITPSLGAGDRVAIVLSAIRRTNGDVPLKEFTVVVYELDEDDES